MDFLNFTQVTQERLLKDLKEIDFTDPNWAEPFTKFDAGTKQSIVIWYLKELIEKKEYVDEIFAISKIYAEDKDPLPTDDNIKGKIETGEEIRNIFSVRGTVCWLLTSIAATFRTEFYPEIISILEKLAFDPVYYVRTQTTVPLSFFARNILARHNADGTKFDFKDENREQVTNLVFRMLQEHRDLPRVLESMIRIFDGLRGIDESQAQQVIEHLFYNSKGELQPEYLTHQAVPLLLYYAEFRSNMGDGFNGKWFQEFAIKVLNLSQEEAPYLRSTFMWHTWKEINSNLDNYLKFKKYISLFFNDTFEDQPLGQYDFLVMEVLKVSPEDGVDLFKKQLDYVLKWSSKFNIQNHGWLLTAREIVEEIARVSPKDLMYVLRKITEILSQEIYVGSIESIYKSYLLVPNKEDQLAMRPEILELFEVAKKTRWAGELPDTV